MKTVRLLGLSQRAHAHRLIDEAPDGYVVKIAAETRRDAQNRLLHAMLGDIRQQVPDMQQHPIEDMKLIFMHALRNEMRMLPELEGQGMFIAGQRTSTLTVAQFAGLVDLVTEYGARKGVRWSERREAVEQE